MSWFKIKIRLSDKLFSEFIRKRDNWHCVYRFKCTGVEDFRYKKGGLHCSHFQKRRHESVRYDPENADASCIPCHYFVENNEHGQRTLEEFKKKQLGERAYKLLLIRKEGYQKKDEKLAILYCEKLLSELDTTIA